MQWLKILLGEENYNKIPEETLNMIKKSLGESEYIQNDPTKIIPKHIFNEKIRELKLKEETIKTLQSQLKSTGEMVTEKDMLEKLAIQEAENKQLITDMEKKHKKEVEQLNKEQLLTNYLSSQKCLGPDLLLKQVDYDKLVVNDGKLLNADSIVLPLKEAHPYLFEKQKKAGNTPIQGENPSLNIKPDLSKENLIKQYDEAFKNGDYVGMTKTQRLIESLDNKE